MNSFLLTTDDPLLALTSHAEGHTFTVENISGIGLHLPPQLSQKGNRSRRFGFATPLSASHQIGSPAAQIEIVCRDGIAVARKASEAKELPVILVVDVDALQLIDASLGPLGESFPLRDAILHAAFVVQSVHGARHTFSRFEKLSSSILQYHGNFAQIVSRCQRWLPDSAMLGTLASPPPPGPAILTAARALVNSLIGVLLAVCITVNWAATSTWFLQTCIPFVSERIVLVWSNQANALGVKIIDSHLDATLRSVLQWLFGVWASIFLEGAVFVIGSTLIPILPLVGLAGASSLLACLADILKLLMSPLALLRAVFRSSLSVVKRLGLPLLRMFFGKKLNPLRKRVDEAAFAPSQLTLGSVFLLILFFLLPLLCWYWCLIEACCGAATLLQHCLLRCSRLLDLIPIRSLLTITGLYRGLNPSYVTLDRVQSHPHIRNEVFQVSLGTSMRPRRHLL